MKRSTAITLLTIGTGIAVFYAVRDPGRTAEAHVFRTVDDCVLGGLDAARCRAEFAEAQIEHERSAPRFATRESCESEYGRAGCEEKREGSGVSAFVPLLAGYMFGQLNSRAPVAPQPLYPPRPGITEAECPRDPMTGQRLPNCQRQTYRTGTGTTIFVGDGGVGRTTSSAQRTGGWWRSSSTSTTSVPRTTTRTPSTVSRQTTTVRNGFGGTSRSFSSRSFGS